jgi:beta-glucosidase
MDPIFASLLGLGGGAALFNAWWNTARQLAPSRLEERPGAKFPEGFLWGAGEDAFQHEGGNYGCDWHEWIHSEPSPIDRGAKLTTGADFWNRWPEDLQLCKEGGHTMHRIGVEWSRIEPAPGEWDEEAIEQYVEMLRVMKEEHGFVTFLNLWHFTLPLWLAEEGGWNSPKAMEHWERYVKKCAQVFAPYVDYWSTMIDSQIYPLVGYLLGEIPPNKKDAKDAADVYVRLIWAHAKAYRWIKEHAKRPGEPDYDPQVGQVYFFFDIFPRGFVVDHAVSSLFQRLFNWAYLDGVIDGDVRVFVPFEVRRERSPELKNTMDWLGVNYFTRMVVGLSPLERGFITQHPQKKRPMTDMDWEIFPEGLYRTVNQVRRRYGDDIPLFITECGLADAEDKLRPRFITDHLGWTHRLIEEGANIKGFFYWSLTDNWEWALGDWPRFGLYGVDYETKERIERPSARLFADIAKNNALPDELPPRLS